MVAERERSVGVTGAVGLSIDSDLVRGLVAGQFPQWRELPVVPVAQQGWDNRTYRLGNDLTVRLPSAAGYVAAIEKENDCLPLLAPHLPQAIPVPVATGEPTADYPFPWSIRRWLPGDILHAAARLDLPTLATDLGAFLVRLRAAPTTGGPAAGRHSFFRGCAPVVYADEVKEALAALSSRVDVPACERVWDAAVASQWAGDPVWFHGDIATGNLLARNGRLSAVIDFGTCGIGDPACDLVIAWTLFTGDTRALFRRSVGLPGDAWARARGWALWKALITLAWSPQSAQRTEARRVIDEVLADPLA